MNSIIWAETGKCLLYNKNSIYFQKLKPSKKKFVVVKSKPYFENNYFV